MKGPRNRHATRELAKRLGLSQAAVEIHRRAKFGRVQRAPRAWTPREDRLLGTRRDAEVARLTGRHPATVLGRRRWLGIPPAVEQRPWTPKEDRLLGTASDEALAKKLGRSHTTVGNRRRTLGIPRYPRPGTWTPEEERLLGTMSDPKVARRLGRSIASVQQRRQQKNVPSPIPCRPWSPREDAVLGTMSDQEVSRVLGRGICGVKRRRMILHINLKEWPNAAARTGTVRKWTAAEKRLVGRMPDSKLAKRLGRSYQSVARMRQSLGRPLCRSPHPKGWKPW